nr:WTAP [Dugesia japonica]
MNSSLEDQNSILIKENNKLKEQIEIKNRELDKLEHVLLANLAHKEQEITDLSAQIEDMKAVMNPCNQQLRCMGLDPAVNVVFLRIKKDMKAANEKLEQTQNDLQAWKFTPDSQTGKRMMTRMRVLLQENEELGKMNQSGRTAKLESEISMKRTLIEELKQTNSEYENVIEEMDCETECFQTSIFMLQQQLAIAKNAISGLSDELEKFSPGKSQTILSECNWNVSNKEESMEGIEVSSDQDLNGSSCPNNHLSDIVDNVKYPMNPEFALKCESNVCSLNEIHSNSDSIVDDRTTNDNDNSNAIITSQIHESSLNYHNPLIPETDDLKPVIIDSESNNIMIKKHSVKSNSAFNQKKLTSS